MQDEDIFFWQNELGKTFIELNRLEKSDFRKKNSLCCLKQLVIWHLRFKIMIKIYQFNYK